MLHFLVRIPTKIESMHLLYSKHALMYSKAYHLYLIQLPITITRITVMTAMHGMTITVVTRPTEIHINFKCMDIESQVYTMSYAGIRSV